MSIFKSKLFLGMLVFNVAIAGWVSGVAGKWGVEQPQYLLADSAMPTSPAARSGETEMHHNSLESAEIESETRVTQKPGDDHVDGVISDALEGLMGEGLEPDHEFLMSLADEATVLVTPVDHFNKVAVVAPERPQSKSALVEGEAVPGAFFDALIHDMMDEPDRSEAKYLASLAVEVETRINEMRTIVVAKGDTLWDIAARAYNDGRQFRKIYQANPHVKSADEIVEGMILRVPI